MISRPARRPSTLLPGLAVLVAAVPAIPLGGCGPSREPRTTSHASPTFSELLRAHLARYPLAEAVDVYKFAHQSVFGPAHAVPGREEAKRYLDEELATVVPGPAGEPVLDVLGGELARVNLRPFTAAGGDPVRLLDAFVATAARVRGDPAVMRERLAAAAAALRGLGRAAEADRLAALAHEEETAGYRAVHHSETYRTAYRPAYRVVLVSLLADAMPRAAGARMGAGPVWPAHATLAWPLL